jgi:hypothetical protein
MNANKREYWLGKSSGGVGAALIRVRIHPGNADDQMPRLRQCPVSEAPTRLDRQRGSIRFHSRSFAVPSRPVESIDAA